MKKTNYFSIIIIVFIFTIQNLNAQITGAVFRDYNGNGTQESAEPYVAGIIVNAFDASGIQCGSAVTTDSGSGSNYSITGCAGPVRIEFDIPNGGCDADIAVDFPALGGAAYGSDVQFATGSSSEINFAIHDPNEYGGDPTIVPDIYNIVLRAGNPIPTPPAPTGDDTYTANFASVIKTGYFEDAPYVDASNWKDDDNSRQIGHTALAVAGQTGTLWGSAYSKQADRLFVSALLRRHAGMGPLGPGGIYIINPATPDLAGNLNFVSLDALGFPTHASSGVLNIKSNVARDLPAQPFGYPQYDIDAFDQVAKVSLGDLDISADGRYLFVVNLYDRMIYRIDLQNPANPIPPTASEVTSYAIPDPCSGANAGEYRPWALKVHRGKLLVGVVCSGQDAALNEVGNSSSMSITIYEYDLGANNMPSAPSVYYSQDLTYRDNEDLQGGLYPVRWKAWRNRWTYTSLEWPNPSPVFTDIEFDNDGNLLMGLMDRRNYQIGSENYDISGVNTDSYHLGYANGDIIKMDKASDCTLTYATGPFHYNDFYDDNTRCHTLIARDPAHNEQTLGGISVHRFGDRDEIIATALNPVTVVSNGYVFYNNDDGTQVRANEIWFDALYESGTASTKFGKAGGLGDIEILAVTSPVEIGNRVWEDTDGDGVQDADEPGIAGVTIELVKTGNVIATATTNANGNYIFSNNPTGTTDVSFIYDITQLEAGMDYIIRIPNISGANKQAVITGELSPADTGEGVNANRNDSDGTSSGDDADAQVSASEIPRAGANNHSYDFGFRAGPPCPVTQCGTVDVVKN